MSWRSASFLALCFTASAGLCRADDAVAPKSATAPPLKMTGLAGSPELAPIDAPKVATTTQTLTMTGNAGTLAMTAVDAPKVATTGMLRMTGTAGPKPLLLPRPAAAPTLPKPATEPPTTVTPTLRPPTTLKPPSTSPGGRPR